MARNFKGEAILKHLNKYKAYLVGLFLLAAANLSASTGGSMPWDNPLSIVARSITGPAAISIALIGIGIAGATLIFSHELGHFGKTICYLVLAVGVLVTSGTLLSGMYGVSAALI